MNWAPTSGFPRETHADELVEIGAVAVVATTAESVERGSVTADSFCITGTNIREIGGLGEAAAAPAKFAIAGSG